MEESQVLIPKLYPFLMRFFKLEKFLLKKNVIQLFVKLLLKPQEILGFSPL